MDVESPDNPNDSEDMEGVQRVPSSDPLKTYLKEMRSVALLTKEEETGLVKEIEQCRMAIAGELLKTRITLEELNHLINRGDEKKGGEQAHIFERVIERLAGLNQKGLEEVVRNTGVLEDKIKI